MSRISFLILCAYIMGCSSDSQSAQTNCTADGVVLTITSAPIEPIVDHDVAVYGTLKAPANEVPVAVLVGAVASGTLTTGATLSCDQGSGSAGNANISAVADSDQFATWHATVPLAVLIGAAHGAPGCVRIVAQPVLDCSGTQPNPGSGLGNDFPVVYPDAAIDAPLLDGGS